MTGAGEGNLEPVRETMRQLRAMHFDGLEPDLLEAPEATHSSVNTQDYLRFFGSVR